MPIDRGQRGWCVCLTVASILWMGCVSGCSKEKLNELADTVKEQGGNLVKESKKMTDSLVEPAEEPLPETGKMTINMADSIEINQAIVQMHVVGDGRKNSLQITSYPPGQPRVPSPAVFLQATTEVETAALLAGKSIACTMFFDAGGNLPIAKTAPDHPIIVTFGSMNMQEKTIPATIDACSLQAADGTSVDLLGGEILAIVEGN